MGESFAESFRTLFAGAAQIMGQYLPSALAAVGIILLGWVIAMLARKSTRFIAEGAQQRLDHIKWLQSHTQQIRAYRTAPAFLSSAVFWIVLLFFAVAAVEALGLPALSTLLGRVTTYLPRVLASLLIILAGFLAGDVLRGLMSRSLARMGVAYSAVVAQTVQVLVVLVAVIVGVEHAGVDSTVLTVVLSIAFGTTLGAVALAFGLGARSTVANMLSVQQVAREYKAGDGIRIGEVEGRIADITQTSVIVDGAAGRIMIPGQRFSDEVSVRVTLED